MPFSQSKTFNHVVSMIQSTKSSKTIKYRSMMSNSNFFPSYFPIHKYLDRMQGTSNNKKCIQAGVRFFASKKKNGSNKKKISLPNYGTPKTGLILPQSPKTIIQQSNDNLDSPLIDQSLSPPTMNMNQNKIYTSPPSSSSSLLFDISSNNLNIVDQTTMYDPTIHLPNKPNFNNPKLNYEPGTKLGEELMKVIAINGSPITVAEYMKQCLRNEQFGYYTNPPPSSSSSNDGMDDTDDIDDIDNDHDGTKSTSNNKGLGHRLIGQHGDFTTAPEISQIFGECITIWLLTQYEALNKPKKIQLVELGPGRGTLMCDILRSAQSIKGLGEDFINALCNNGTKSDGGNGNQTRSGITNQIHGVHFVEVSENLRLTQKEALEKMQQDTAKPWYQIDNKNDGGKYDDSYATKIQFDFQMWETKSEREERVAQIMRRIREKKDSGQEVNDKLLEEILSEQRNDSLILDTNNSNKSNRQSSNLKELPIHWHDSFESIPFQTSSTTENSGEKRASIPTFIVCQEFFDALPVHVFQKTENGWRERLVDVAVEDDGDDENNENGNGSDRVQVKMIDGTTATILGTTSNTSVDSKTSSYSINKKKPRFRFVLSPDVTPALRSLLRVDDNGYAPAALDAAPIGTIMEVSPEALTLVQDMAIRIDECQGAALIIDYGNEGNKDSLRAFRKHEQVDVLSSPGTVDITADVDFTAMKNAINVDMQRLGDSDDKNNRKEMEVVAFGPKTQGEFLSSMGAVERTIRLIEDDNTTDDQAEDLCTALERLVSAEEMGERFKVLSIARKKEGIFPPPGF